MREQGKNVKDSKIKTDKSILGKSSEKVNEYSVKINNLKQTNKLKQWENNTSTLIDFE